MNYMYVRVSTSEQNVDRQLVTAQKYNIPDDCIFTDKLSGKNTDRPELQRLLETIKPGDTLYVHEISRLGRNLLDMISITKSLNAADITVHFEEENLTLANKDKTGITQLVFNLFASIAEFERQQILERQRQGIEIAKEQGKYTGKKPIDFDQEMVNLACESYLNRKCNLKRACSMIQYTTKNGDTRSIAVSTFYKLLDKYVADNNIHVDRYCLNKYK